MKTENKKRDHVRNLFNLLMVVGLIVLLFAPGAAAEAKTSLQTGNVTAPLAPQLTWSDLGLAERSFPVNGETVTLSGNVFGAVEEFNLESNEEVATYYTSPSLAVIGWQEVDNFPQSNGVSTLYSREGVFALVEFSGCKDAPALACLTVWESVPTDLVPQGSSKFIQPLVVPFDKTAPVNHISNVGSSVALVWNSYGGANLNHYRYCMDTVNNGTCDASGGWTSVWSGTTVTVSSLAANTTYYWNVEAVLDNGTKIQTNGGDWWYFTVGSLVVSPPGVFSKNLPANGATGQSITPTLTWGASAYATSYSYCVDTINNALCDTSWVNNGTSTVVSLLSGLAPGTYYWQARATNTLGSTDANSNTWWSFTTVVSPPGVFSKNLPANGATDQSSTPTLTWGASAYATTYSYCVDTINNALCDTNWVNNGTSTFVSLLSGLAPGTYYWHVRATNTLGATDANSGTWWSFTVSPGPANDTSSTALALSSIPDTSTVTTTAATIDSGTTNTCSPGLGYASVWYAYTAPGNKKIYADTFGTNYDTFIAIWTKNPNDTLNLITCNDNSAGLLQSSVNFAVTNGTTYYIQVAQKNPGTAPTLPPGGTLHFQVTTYADVTGNNSFWRYVEGINAAAITGGCATSPDLLYCPSSYVSRAQMAVFLLVAKHGSVYTPPLALGTVFGDVPASHWAAKWIEALAAEGITGGCGSGNYCPDAVVTRAQMAVFLLVAKHGSVYTPPPALGTVFGDVPASHWAAKWIEALAAEGITGGCGSGNYCPDSYVTRDQMAVFLSVAFSIPTKP